MLRLDRPDRPEPGHLPRDRRGKRSALADLRLEHSGCRVHELLDDADVLVTGYRPGALALGLDDATTRSRHRHLVHVSLSAWGAGWAGGRFRQHRPGSLGNRAGLRIERCHREIQAGALPVQALDVAAGYGMAAAVLALLAVRPQRGGGSAHVSLARTAGLLLDAGPDPAAQPQAVTVPTTDTSSPHGRLTRTASPVSLDGISLTLPAPGEYGTADLTWL